MPPAGEENRFYLSQKMELFQRQELRLDLRQIQVMKLLPLTTCELQVYLQQELQENPFLEIRQEAPEEEKEETKIDEIDDERLEVLEDLEREQAIAEVATRSPEADLLSDQVMEMLQNIPATKSFKDLLKEQLSEQNINSEIKEIAEAIIDSLDENGYLIIKDTEGNKIDDPLSEIARVTGYPREMVEKALEIVQSIGPKGIASRNIQECLTLQLSKSDMLYEIKYDIINIYWQDFVKGKITEIANKMNEKIEDVKVAVEEIKKLRPYPITSGVLEEAVSPDIIIKEIDGKYEVIVDQDIPSIRLPKGAIQMLRSLGKEIRELKKKTPENKIIEEKQMARKLLIEKYKKAMGIIDGLVRRQNTLYQIGMYIVKNQRGFLEGGIEYLKPASVHNVADEFKWHPSTLYRVIKNKYVQTPVGVYPLKFFFQKPLENAGELKTRTHIEEAIRRIVEEEDKEAPYTDEEIAKELQKQNIKITRRTVTKFRERMGFLPSRLRIKRQS